MGGITESIPEETRIAQMKVIDKIAEIVVEKNKTLVMVEIIPADIKRIDGAFERLPKLSEAVEKAIGKTLGIKDCEIRIRAYGISDESKTVIES